MSLSRVSLAALPLLVAGLLTPALTESASAQSAPTNADFFAAPTPLPKGKPGELIRYQSTTVNLGAGAPAVNATTVMYHSRTADNADDAVTGTILQPQTAWTGPGPRPIVSFAVGTQGLAQSCAPSKQMAAGTEYEASNISLALQQGWDVAVTDYEGYTTGSTPTYVAGLSEAHAVLDIVRAASQIPGSDVTAASPLTTWGYSQGGGASAWATVVQPTYASELHLLGDASGGVPADSRAVNDSLNGSVGAGFLIYGMIGFAQAFPTLVPLYNHANAAGLSAFALAKTQCTSQSLSTFAGANFSNYLNTGETLSSFQALPGVAQVLADNSITFNSALPHVPVFQYHGTADEIVPLAQAQTLHSTWCAKGVQTQMDLFPSDHLSTNAQAAPLAVSFLADRYAGRPYSPNCLT
ncbi:MAG: lipase family protein [Mycobacteriales bacterium]